MSLYDEIQQGESRTLEFKKELPADSSKWVKTIIAFANGAGGRLVIGVSNQHEVVGIPKETDIFVLKDKIADTISEMCAPQIMFDIYQESVENKVLVVVEVFPGNDTPYYIKSFGKENGTFIRLNATTRNADITTIDELELRGKRRYYDELPFTELEVTDKDVSILCEEFSLRTKHEITAETLVNMRMLQRRENTFVAIKAYAIFLGKHDSFSRIQCARFKGTERVHFIDKKDFDGTLLSQVEGAYNFVLEHINLGIEINGLYRKEQYELPEAVIRELILNAVIHRNYMMSSCIQVAVYDDRVEISSPGSLFGTLTLEEALSGRSSIRNKVIAGVCEKLGIVEGWGTGLIITHRKMKMFRMKGNFEAMRPNGSQIMQPCASIRAKRESATLRPSLAHSRCRALRRGQLQGAAREPPEKHEHDPKARAQHRTDFQGQALPQEAHVSCHV